MTSSLRRMVTGALALSAMTGSWSGCSDGDDNGNGRDAGAVDAGAVDAGRDAGDDAGLLSCGEGEGAVSCPPGSILTATLPACCVQDEARCGYNLDDFSELSQGVLAGCVETNQPTVPPTKPVSESCSALWATLGASATGDGGVGDAGTGGAGDAAVPGGLTVTVAGQTVTFPGCCRLNDEGEGECGVLANEVLGAQLGFGCVPLSSFRDALFDSEAEYEQVRSLAVCDPATGEAPVANN